MSTQAEQPTQIDQGVLNADDIPLKVATPKKVRKPRKKAEVPTTDEENPIETCAAEETEIIEAKPKKERKPKEPRVKLTPEQKKENKEAKRQSTLSELENEKSLTLERLDNEKKRLKELNKKKKKFEPKRPSTGGLTKKMVLAKPVVEYLEKYLTEPEEAEKVESFYDNGRFIINRPELSKLIGLVLKKRSMRTGLIINHDAELIQTFGITFPICYTDKKTKEPVETSTLTYNLLQKYYTNFLSAV